MPAGQLSFRIFMDKPLYLSGDEPREEIRSEIQAALRRNFTLTVSDKEFQEQKFGVPPDFEQRFTGWSLPSVCRGRFLGQGQVAGEHFHMPSMTDCVFAFFDDDSFSLLWLELDAVAAFYRSEQQPSS